MQGQAPSCSSAHRKGGKKKSLTSSASETDEVSFCILLLSLPFHQVWFSAFSLRASTLILIFISQAKGACLLYRMQSHCLHRRSPAFSNSLLFFNSYLGHPFKGRTCAEKTFFGQLTKLRKQVLSRQAGHIASHC